MSFFYARYVIFDIIMSSLLWVMSGMVSFRGSLSYIWIIWRVPSAPQINRVFYSKLTCMSVIASYVS